MTECHDLSYLPHSLKKREKSPLATNRASKLDNWLKKTLIMVEEMKNLKIKIDLKNKILDGVLLGTSLLYQIVLGVG